MITIKGDAKRILIVEDDVDIAAIEKDYLEAAGFHVRVVGSWDEARGAMGAGVDLFILDVMLPGVDGMEAVRQLRGELGVDVPAIIVSARETDADKIMGLGLGADDYLVKPFSPSELVARVKAHLTRYGRLTNAREVVNIGSLRVDTPARRVFIDGEEARLTKKEFDLLLFFIRNPNVVFSKDALLDKVWGLDAVGDSTTVTVHVNNLREKIAPKKLGKKASKAIKASKALKTKKNEEKTENKPTAALIETVWGAGYRFKI